MKHIFIALVSIFLISSCDSDDVDPKSDYNLIWSDEFDSNASLANWNYEIGDGTDYGLAPGWGNSELQLYTDSQNNSLIRTDDDGNSVLSIFAKEAPGENNYTSAKLTTQNIRSVRYGRVEARIRVPEGQGLWPAFWLLGDNIDEIDWPGCGEIDIMEVIGNSPDIVHSTLHYAGDDNRAASNQGSLQNDESLANDYHIYSMDWTPDNITFYLDDRTVNTVPLEDNMKEFQRSFYLILNVAVGGNWPGYPDASTTFPQIMDVDWIRVHEKNDFDPPAPPALDINEETVGGSSTSLAGHAFNGNFDDFGNLVLTIYGGGGEPDISASDIAIEGDSSALLSYPGGSWGGAFFAVESETLDASSFKDGNLKFSLHTSVELADIEIKLESIETAASVFLKDYSGVDVGNGFMEYSIPISDFEGLEITDLRIPFALWNPIDANEDYLKVDVIVDNVYFEE